MTESTVKTPSAPSQPAELVRRCRWCELRIGATRYFLDGVWERVFSVPHFFGYNPIFTDGICPECLAVEKAKLTSPQGAPGEEFHPRREDAERTGRVGSPRMTVAAGCRPISCAAPAGVTSVAGWRSLVIWVSRLRRYFLPVRNLRAHRLAFLLNVSPQFHKL